MESQEAARVLDLPVGGDGCGDVRFSGDSVSLVAEFEFRRNKEDRIGGIRFNDVVAHRFHDEMHSHGFSEFSYDTVVEIIDSPWMDALIRNEPTGLMSSASGKHHFAILLSNNGYLEVISESVVSMVTRNGRLTLDE